MLGADDTVNLEMIKWNRITHLVCFHLLYQEEGSVGQKGEQKQGQEEIKVWDSEEIGGAPGCCI